MMRHRLWPLAGVLALILTVPLTAQYRDISDLKLARPEDRQDVKSTPPPKGAVVLFDGKSLDGWGKRSRKGKAHWKILDGGILQVEKGGDILTTKEFGGSFTLHVEFRVPYLPNAHGQARGNSGVYLQGRYEVQILDSYGLESKANDCGAIYGIAAPKGNACKAPTVWQSYDIEFHPPKCVDGKKVERARMTVYHNGVRVHDNVALTQDNTVAGLGGNPCTPGPILLQEHGSPVQFRNIWLLPKEPAEEAIHVLWIGNSYTYYNDLPRMVAELARAGGQPSLVHEQQTPGGCTLEKHRNDGKALKKLRARQWDFVVLQEHSQQPLKDSRPMFAYATKFDAEIKKQGGQTLLYLPFPLARAPENQEKLTQLHEDLAAKIKARVVPVGPAWAKVRAMDKPPTLYHTDQVHPGKDGSYLAACVFYATLYGKSPEGLPGKIGGLSDKEARQFQGIAWQVVKDQSKEKPDRK
jgi:hypothetical protein